MQGTAADIIKYAMIAVDKWVVNQADSARIIMQVHDELVFEIDEKMIGDAQKAIVEIMQSVVTLNVPLVVDVGVGENWAIAH